MADIGLMFKPAMVRALWDGRKEQTRRVAKRQDGVHVDGKGGWLYGGRLPYAVGDRIWVRETFCGHLGALPADFEREPFTVPQNGGTHLFYRADGEEKPFSHSRWRPSMFMPRWASRLTLTVTDVWVERLGAISPDDAKAEGFATLSKDGRLWKWGIPDRDGLPGDDDLGWHWQDWQVDPRLAYARLWDSMYGRGAWELDPWVVAARFAVHRCNIDQMEAGHG